MFPLKQFNFLIGTNNSGKSIVLDFISRFLSDFPRSTGKQGLGSTDAYRGRNTGTPTMFFAIPTALFFQNLRIEERESCFDLAQKICSHIEENGAVWLKTQIGSNVLNFEQDLDPRQWYTGTTNSELNGLQSKFLSYTGGEPLQALREVAGRFLTKQQINLPQAKIIPAVREVGSKEVEFSDYSGKGLINRLAEIQSPDHDKRDEQRLFDKINGFLANVLGNASARIEIPHNRDHVLVHIDNKVLPLKSLGTGVQEVLMLASFCTLSAGQIICIEEPEIHLHPILQRKFVRYLIEETDNQYFVATHSAAFIDTPGAALLYVSSDGEQTRISEAVLPTHKHSICTDLGYKASDILQSNAVIWVEGPSDRLYINHWISTISPELIEGIHYSIMFYGGKLLSHLSADGDSELNEFISLNKLNRNLAIVMDSDKSNSTAEIRASKRRVCEEIEGSGIAWVTQGREIENYIDPSTLERILQQLYTDRYVGPASRGRFNHAIHFRQRANESRSRPEIYKDADKVRIAKAVSELDVNWTILDLRPRVEELVAMIKKANHL